VIGSTPEAALSSKAYRDGISWAYQGELIGESVYRELANCSIIGDQKAKLRASWRLKPIAERLGIEVSDAQRLGVIERRVSELQSLTWPDFIEKALRDWPPYIARFEALKQLAPAGDVDIIQWLVDYEVALVAFARTEQDAMGSNASFLKLQIFLDKIDFSCGTDGDCGV
jgi:hypothetical protein